MELTPRKQAVLKAIVKAYIETGEPIGSKNLMLLLDNAPSPATLRNEMSELSQLGFLHQPHTSAGRVPTVDGYRLYINSLMTGANLSPITKNLIDSELDNLNCEPESIPIVASKVLSKLTGLPSIVGLTSENSPKIKRIELLPISRFSVMLLIITNDGRTRNRIFRKSGGLNEEMQKCFFDLVENKIKTRRINELTKAYMQSVAASAGIYALEIMPLLSAIFETAAGIEQSDITLIGENALYNITSNEEEARRIISLINQKDRITPIMESIKGDSGVIFGSDIGYRELKGKALISAKFNICGNYKGFIGLLGPDRLSYDQILPAAQYTAQKITSVMTEAQKDMED